MSGDFIWILLKYTVGATLSSAGVWFVFDKIYAVLRKKQIKLAPVILSLKWYVVMFLWPFTADALLPFLPLSSYIHNLTHKAIVLTIFFILSWAAGVVVEFAMKTYSDKLSSHFPITGLFASIIRWTVVSLGVLAGFAAVDIPITPMVTTLGVGGVAIALATQDILSNVFHGITMMMAHQIKPGDYVIVDDSIEGFVKDITWRNTVLYAPLAGTNIIVSNNKMSTAVIKNIPAGSGKYGLVLSVGVSYDANLEKVYSIVSDVAHKIWQTVPDVNKGDAPVVAFQSFGDSSITINILLRLHNPAPIARWHVYDAFVKEIKKAFDEEGIDIPFSQHDIHIKDINMTGVIRGDENGH